jgi:hypothetical protein
MIASRLLRRSPSAGDPSFSPIRPKYDLPLSSRCGRGRKKITFAHILARSWVTLPFGHPFLDGNGRTIVTLFSALAQRAGFSVDWSATDKDAYLNALTQEIDAPSKGHLDNYLEQFMREPIAHEELAAQVIKTPGLDGRLPAGDENEVVGNVDAPEVKAQYEAMLLKRGKKN